MVVHSVNTSTPDNEKFSIGWGKSQRKEPGITSDIFHSGESAPASWYCLR